MARVELESISKIYGDFRAAEDINLDIADGEFLILLGPSGCGKTTTLRMVAGFIEPTAGTIRIGGKDVTDLPPWERSTGLVFQNYALFPHLTVAQNVAFGLEMRKVPKAQIRPRVEEALQLVRLGHLAERYPRQMSGGQQQRVALARALAFEPDVLLLDEPLSNLDAKLRQEVRVEIRNLQQRLGITAIMVTHDQEEALTMADRLVVMSEGRICQVGSQRDLYDHPKTEFVASFVGRSSFLRGRFSGGKFISTGGLEIVSDRKLVGSAVMAVRPERVRIANEPVAGAANCFPGVVEFVSYMGGSIDIHVRLNNEDVVIAQVTNNEGLELPGVGDTVHVAWSSGAAVFADMPKS
ncbi:ABC transporter ATP-binding protein [Rhizobiaceae bacterium BDR2-2]|uniref:Spermidine/putrescine import ATP-binding protein PotA n=1 Tax=Ectorhizobium quercum TaxID=2965071 RepID=A0AAE3N1G8_9HYPH|nr:ABC transporter ATP-binding protein [Ectorhizobium quercum]MCX8997949.1 ABC transporter ATP-binding protein [Ectorhizobium quercum]